MLDELTGSGSVSTAASIADFKIASLSGEKDAFPKSFTISFLGSVSAIAVIFIARVIVDLSTVRSHARSPSRKLFRHALTRPLSARVKIGQVSEQLQCSGLGGLLGG